MSTAAATAAATLLLTVGLVVSASGVEPGTNAAYSFAARHASAHVPAVASGGGASMAYAEGAPPGFSGGFGEQSCHGCHFHHEINVGPGRVVIANVPDRYVGGERYELTIRLERPGLRLAGFQLTARLQDGGAQAGTLAPAAHDENRVGVDMQGGIQYAGHRRPGALPASADTGRWTIVWTAPKSSAPVVFHVSANAADGDETAEGDHIHTAVVETMPGGEHGARMAAQR